MFSTFIVSFLEVDNTRYRNRTIRTVKPHSLKIHMGRKIGIHSENNHGPV